MAIYFPNTELGEASGETWRLTTGFTGDASPMINWERADQTGGGTNYNVLNESSGIFTFNQTGWYHVNWWCYYNGNVNSEWNEMALQLSHNNGGNWTWYQYAQGWFGSGLQRYNMNSTATTFHIPSISGNSTRKIRFMMSVDDNNTNINGSSSQSHTGFTILKFAEV